MPETRATPTEPAINEAQNSDRILRLLSAQRRLYSDAKHVHAIRIGIVGIGAFISIAVALRLPDHRVVVSVLTVSMLLLVSVLGGSRERKHSSDAASVQEEIDTLLFQLPWNDMFASHPSPTLIAQAAGRYDGPSLTDWYPGTDAVVRSLDVLICQRSNVGWGASLHGAWANVLRVALVILIAIAIAVGLYYRLSFADTLVVSIAPMLAPIKELIEMSRANSEFSRVKAAAEEKISVLWRRALSDPLTVTTADCRKVQDYILTLRRTNPSVPDWFDKLHHDAHESAMRVSAEHLVEEARQRGLA